MRSNLKRFTSLTLSSLLTFFTLTFPPAAQAQFTKKWSGVCVAGVDNDIATFLGLQCLIANILSIAITGVGFAGFVMLVIGSFKWLTSGGNTKGTQSAQSTITYAVLGLVVALSAFIILNLISNFTGVKTILNFKLTV